MTSIKRRLFSGTAFNSIGLVATALINLVIVTKVVRTLGLESFGLVALSGLFSILGLVSFLTFGIPKAITREISVLSKSDEHQKARVLIWSCLLLFFCIGVFVSCIMMLFLDVIVEDIFSVAEFFQDKFRFALIILFLSHIYQFPFLIVKAIFIGLSRFGILQLVLVGNEMVRGIIIIMLLNNGFNFDSVIIVNALVALPGFFILLYLLPRSLFHIRNNHSSWLSISVIKKLAGLLFVQRMSATLFHSLDRFMSGLFLGPIGVGSVEIFSKIPLLFNRVLGLSISAIIPSISGLSIERDRGLLIDIYHSGFKIYYSLICPPLTVLFLFAGKILNLWIGPVTEDIIICLQLMCIWCMLYPLQFGGNMLIGLNRKVGSFTIFLVSQPVLKGVAIAILFPLIGLYSFPLSYLISLTAYIYLLYVLKSVIGLSYKRQLLDVSSIILSSLIPVGIYHYCFSIDSIQNWYQLVTYGFIIYLIQTCFIYIISLRSHEQRWIKSKLYEGLYKARGMSII